MLSLAGAGFAWGPAVPLQQWVENAAASLEDLMTRYSLVGLDVNYEARVCVCARCVGNCVECTLRH